MRSREVDLNIVFDLGGVVVRWEPDKIISETFTDPKTQALVRAGVFEHPDWRELDRGTLPLAEAIERAAARTGIEASAIYELMNRVPLALTEIPETVDLLYRLRAAGHDLYYLSNMHVSSIEHLERECSFWNVFNGGIISCRVHQIKPEPAMYRALLGKYTLHGADIMFIDDTEANLIAAADEGIGTILFKNARQCSERLRTLGII